MDDTSPQTPSVLFVCAGNTCRSPMAEHLARHRWGTLIQVESAGTSAGLTKVADSALLTIQKLTATHAPASRSRDIEDVDLGAFTWIVALDTAVEQELIRRLGEADERLLTWSIDDPFGGDDTDYDRAAAAILEQLEGFEASILRPAIAAGGNPAPARREPGPASGTALSADEALRRLVQHIPRWRSLLQYHKPGPTARIGIVSKAVDVFFVQALRQKLAEYLTRNMIDAKSIGATRPLERSPFGDVVACLKKARQLVPELHSCFPAAAVKLVDPLPTMRNSLVKPEDYKAPTRQEALDILGRIEQVLEAAPEFFEIPPGDPAPQ